jgi:hypothetical protein
LMLMRYGLIQKNLSQISGLCTDEKCLAVQQGLLLPQSQ